MALSYDDLEFWLPPEFLTDDGFSMDKNERNEFGSDSETKKALFPLEYPNGFDSFGTSSSDLGSPVESVVGSSETESDEEDNLAGLIRQMARSNLLNESTKSGPAFHSEKAKAWVSSGSPQSTLCAVGSGCGCRKGSSHGSPNGSSQVSSPPATWDLLHAAAGEVARMRMNEELYELYHGRGLMCPLRKPSPHPIPVKDISNTDAGFFPYHSLSHQQLQMRFQQLRQQQMLKQQGSAIWGIQEKPNGQYQQREAQNRARNSEFVGGRNGGPLGLSASAWPHLQQAQQQQQQHQHQHQKDGSGMRAVFLGRPGGKRECTGTGVFLPRQVDSTSDTRRKPACSTVLVPARVAQALNLNSEDIMGSRPLVQPPFFETVSDLGPGTAPRFRSNTVYSHQKRNIRPQLETNHEIRLPKEWTY